MSESKESRTSPLRSDEQEFPEPERPITPLEEAGMDVAQLENPPQAEGEREEEDEEQDSHLPEHQVH